MAVTFNNFYDLNSMHKILLFIFHTIAALSKQASLNCRVLTRGNDISQFPLPGESWLDFTRGDTPRRFGQQREGEVIILLLARTES